MQSYENTKKQQVSFYDIIGLMKRQVLFIFITFLFITAYLSAQDRIVSDYSLRSLLTYQYKTSPLTIQKLAFKNDLQYAYDVSFISMGLTVSARLSVPAIELKNIKGIVIMLRGHQHQSNYYTGKGTENPAKRYLEHGWAVIALDFFGYAASSPIPSPSFLAQFYSTINAVELYYSLEQPAFQYHSSVPRSDRIILPEILKKIVFWGHSNGGQVALHSLEVIQKPVTTVLWAPVSLAFPDSAGHYGRGSDWVDTFKELYTADDFSLYNFLDKIAGGTRILLHHGDKDTSTPKAWSDALSKAIEEENLRRDSTGGERIFLRYEVYANANHNLNPYWNTVLPRDAAFWEE